MAMLVLIHEGLTLKRISLEKPSTLIGRSPEADIYISDNLASQNHAKIESKPAAGQTDAVDFYLEDLDSTNHTYINGETVTLKKLVHEDVIRIGKHTFKFIDESESAGDKTTKLHKSWIPGVYYTKE